MSIWIRMTSFSTWTSLTWIDVIEAPWACRTVMGAQVRRHHTLMVLSQLAEARSVFSWLTAMSQISAEWPRSVARRRPSSVAQIFTRQSSEPWKYLALAKILSNRFFLACLQNNCEQRGLYHLSCGFTKTWNHSLGGKKAFCFVICVEDLAE